MIKKILKHLFSGWSW